MDGFYEDEQVPFGDFCLTCGNSTATSSPYCSRACRDEAAATLPTPDLSPLLSAVPPLVSSTSTCSSTASSTSGSPSPLGLASALVNHRDPPPLDLPAPDERLTGSLPLNMHELTFALKSASYAKSPPSIMQHHGSDELQLLRRKNGGHSVPAPLYFRQAAAQRSPALPPTLTLGSSPRRTISSPLVRPSHTSEAMSSFELPPSVTSEDSARPSSASRRRSWTPRSSPSALDSPILRPIRPRERGASTIAEDDSESALDDDSANSSAFAGYLFARVGASIPSTPDSRPPLASENIRGRTSAIDPKQRSVSADPVLPGRPRGFLFGRGNASRTASRDSDRDSEAHEWELDGDDADGEEEEAPRSLRPGRSIKATTVGSVKRVFDEPPVGSPPTRGRSRVRTRAESSSHGRGR